MLRLAAIGLAAGVFSALFGVGGGLVVVPLLILLAGYSERGASAVSLGAIAITALAGATFFAIRGDVEIEYAALVGIPAAAGALAGSALQQRIAARWLSYLFAALLVAVAAVLLVS